MRTTLNIDFWPRHIHAHRCIFPQHTFLCTGMCTHTCPHTIMYTYKKRVNVFMMVRVGHYNPFCSLKMRRTLILPFTSFLLFIFHPNPGLFFSYFLNTSNLFLRQGLFTCFSLYQGHPPLTFNICLIES